MRNCCAMNSKVSKLGIESPASIRASCLTVKRVSSSHSNSLVIFRCSLNSLIFFPIAILNSDIRLFALILFNYLFSNGDAHLKNFSLIARQQGQFTLSPAYDLLNTALHIEDPPFALKDGLYPAAQGKLIQQFYHLGEKVGLAATTVSALISKLTSQSEQVLSLVARSFLSERLKRSYIQYYQRRLKKLAN